MNICLINPSILVDSKIQSPLSSRNKYFINPYNVQHMGLAYLAAVAKADGHHVDVVESAYTGQTVREITERVFSGNYNFVGITCYYYNFKYVIKIVNHIRRHYPNIFICLGGFLPTLSYELVLNALSDINCCIVGEGENTLCELLECLENRNSWHHISGIAFRDSYGEIIVTPKRELIDDLDSLPFPHRTFISERRLASIVTARGCYGTCNYCGIQEFTKTCVGKRFRRRSPDNVFEEILMLAAQGVEYIMFNDSLFHMSSATGRKWFDRFYELNKKHGLNIKYLCDFRANEVVVCRDIIEKFMEIGLYNVNIGIESFVQKQLDFYGKRTTVEQNIQTLNILQDLELRFTMGIMMFDPTTTIAKILEFTETILRMEFYKKTYNVNRPLSIGSCVIATQGTELFDFVKENGLYEMNELNYNFVHADTKRCYKKINEWSNQISELFNLNYLIYIAQDIENDEDQQSLQNLYQELYFIDLEYVKSIAEAIVNHADDAQLREIDSQFVDRVKPLSKEFRQYEDRYKQYLD